MRSVNNPVITTARLRVHVRGTVQGVGFRPFLYRLATELGLAGSVRNDGMGVLLEIEGTQQLIDQFVQRLRTDAPPLARVEDIKTETLQVRGERGFSILQSETSTAAALITPDAATCDACLAELFDPLNRRYHYPFITCTDCGPRFTIAQDTPYDRARTTMSAFAMCDACQAEYDDPACRRFHAQPIACWNCGPQLSLVDANARVLAGGEPKSAIHTAARLLNDGAIVAVKGLGGYHLACRADLQRSVARLRARKQREEKPFAVMVRDVEMAARHVKLSADAVAVLSSVERPIVLLPRIPDANVAAAVAPGTRELGIMLAYSPIHHLLLTACDHALVMTSGNVSDEPIACDNADALARLHDIADAFLWHDRDIHIRTDDSVVRIVCDDAASNAPMLLRRSRGYVPAPLGLPLSAPPILACGAEQKNTFCIAQGRRAWLGHHIGDLENYETFHSFTSGIDHFLRVFRVVPKFVAHDLHPEYLSTKYALEQSHLIPIGVQHHHAHLAAALAEYGETGPAIGVIYDGTGYGTDGTIWGGELLFGDLCDFERIGHLRCVRLPGNAAAIREPWRMACAWLVESTADESPAIPRTLQTHVEPARWRAVARLANTGLHAPATSSMGRLFDAVSALCGIRTRVSYEGQAAIELERVADTTDASAYEIDVTTLHDNVEIDPRSMLLQIVRDVESGVSVSSIAQRFHNAVVAATLRAAMHCAEARNIDVVVLSGGVFQNVLLLEATARALRNAGMRVLVPKQVPPNDGGIAYGQAAIAAARNCED